MPFDLGSILLFVNYLVLAGTFIYAYLKPRDWNEWLVSNNWTYFLTYSSTWLFVFLFVSFFAERNYLYIPLYVLFGVLSLWSINFHLNKTGSKSIIPFLLYMASIGQLLFWASFSLDPENAFSRLGVIYSIGIIVILLGGYIIGFFLRITFPSLYNEHVKVMKEKYGSGAPEIIRFKGGSIFRNVSPSDFVGIGIAYCIWMIVSYFIF